MATVHLGRQLGDAGFGRIVAIKRMHPHLSRQREFVDMFLDEARLVARIRHPNIVPTLDVVVESNELLLVMDYVEGESLSRLMMSARQQGALLPLPVTLGVMVGVLRGLHAAHEAIDEEGRLLGLVHRDVSPQNILVGTDGVARVLDFGIAKARGRTQHTQEGQIKGKPAYMAPEQLLGEPIDRRTDIFAASIVFWEMLTGRRLFRGENEAETMRLVLERIIDPPGRLGAPVASLDSIVLRGLDRDPAQRWETAREMAAAIEATERCATASEIETWVRAMAGDVLVSRRKELAQVEAASALLPVAPAPPVDAPLVDAPLVDAPEAAKKPPRAWLLGGGALLLLGFLAGGRAASLAWAPSAVSSAASAEPARSAAREAPAPLATSVAASSAPSASSAPAQASAPVDPGARPAPSGSPTTTPASPVRKAAKNCQPPYVLDARGIKRPKPECYR